MPRKPKTGLRKSHIPRPGDAGSGEDPTGGYILLMYTGGVGQWMVWIPGC
jgi:hypothetical protein